MLWLHFIFFIRVDRQSLQLTHLLIMTKSRLPEIVLLHCIGVLMILFGYFAQYFNNCMLGEILITGVPLFLFMSGYLVGLKPIPPRYQEMA